jgi:hypothetical protein
VRDAARRAFDARSPALPVADLIFDSIMEGNGTPAPDEIRELRFSEADVTIDLRVIETPEVVHAVLRLQPAARATVEVRTGRETMHAETDGQGRAEIDLPPGLVSVVLRPQPGEVGRALQTAWVRI